MEDINNSFEFSEISLDDNFLEQPFYVCTVQLRTPFWKEAFQGSKDNKKYIGWHVSSLQERKKKIESLLNEIKNNYIAKGVNLKIIVFPEYSIENCMISFFKKYSLSNNVMIIAGDYDQTERNNFAHIIYPSNGKCMLFKQSKLSRSKLDESFISEIPNDQRKIYKFSWNSKTRTEKNHIIIYVCHDFLDYFCQTIDKINGGLYIVIMCSPRIDEFCGLSYVSIRSIRGYRSNVVLLCNSSDNPPIKGDTEEVCACGETQIVGPCEDPLPKIGRFSEGGILARIQLNSLISKPTRLDRTNVIDNISSFSINDKGAIRESEDFSLANKIVINPNAVLQILGLQKIYALFCMKNYSKMLNTFKHIPLQSNGIFGIYDILIKSYDENLDFFEKRLICYLGDKYNDLRDPDLPQRKIFTVNYVIKYRGKHLCHLIDGCIESIINFNELETHYIEDNIDHIKKVMKGISIEIEKEKQLFEQWIFLQVKNDTDLFPEDKIKGYEEYLIFVDMYPSGEKSISLVNREFRKHILPILMSDEKIRTIELCGQQNNGDDYDGSYIIHLVGNLSDVRSIILDSIHNAATSVDIRCRTFVVPAAEPLSIDKNVYLGETIIRNPQLRSFVSEMIPYMKFVDPINPFIIKQVPINVIDMLSTVYSSYKKFVKGDPRRNELLNKFNNFVYGVCYGCLDNDNLSVDIFTRIKSHCSETYFSVTDKIESFLIIEKNNVIDSIRKIEEYDKNKFLSIRISKEKSLKEIIESDQTIFGDLLTIARIWHEKFIPNSGNFVMDIKSLDKAVTYRNIFSHSYRRRMDNMKTFQFSIELMDALLVAMIFEQKYSKQ